jgi:hypothetical protein
MYHFYIFEIKKASNIFDAFLFSMIINYLLPEFPLRPLDSEPLEELAPTDVGVALLVDEPALREGS